MKSVLKYQLIVLFLGILALPFVNDGLGIFKFERKDENRSFKDSLVLNFAKLDNFPGEAEAYIQDNFAFRQPLIHAFSRFKFYGFGESPKPEHTIIGKDGWLFMNQYEIACFTGRGNFSSDQLDQLEQTWDARINYMNDRGIKSYWLIAPIKHSIYGDKIPFKFLKSSKESRVEQLTKKMNRKHSKFVIDPSNELRKRAKNEKVFYKMDNHWNFKAGYYASKALVKQVSMDFPEVKYDVNVHWKDTILKQGIHYNVLGLEELSEMDYVPQIKNQGAKEVKRFGLKAPEGFAYGWEYERHFKNPNAGNDLKVLVIRDSFGAQMMPFIAESFGESLFIFDKWQYGLNEDIIAFYKPDIVIFITLETLVNNLLYI